jgi:lantibiotic modifying enzyme
VRTLTANPLPRDLSPCHGELGIAEALVVLAEREASQAARHRAGQILDAIARHGPYCGSPDGVATPGLLSGLSGIGYGLLRLGFGERVPSALLLEPAVDRPAHGPLK